MGHSKPLLVRWHLAEKSWCVREEGVLKTPTWHRRPLRIPPSLRPCSEHHQNHWPCLQSLYHNRRCVDAKLRLYYVGPTHHEVSTRYSREKNHTSAGVYPVHPLSVANNSCT